MGLFFLLQLPVLQHPAFASQEATLGGLRVENKKDNLVIYFTVKGAFHDNMKETVLSGAPTTFSFYATVEIVRNWWSNKVVAEVKTTHTIKYDTLKKEFSVVQPWKSDKPINTKSFLDAQKLMCEVDGLMLTPVNILEKKGRYRINAKAELNKVTLPFYLHYILLFVSLWDFETDWYSIDFNY